VSGGHLTRYLRTSGTGGVDIVHQLLEDGALGELRTMQAECGEYLTGDHRTMGPELGGGPPTGNLAAADVRAAVNIAVNREVEADTESCGHRFQPVRDPSRFPVCPRCKELAALLDD
jgi:hypothetical protein